MKTCLAFLLVLFAISTFASGQEKNYIYKGTITQTDLITRKATAFSVYMVIGDEELVVNTNPNYSNISVALAIVGGPLGPKRYAVAPPLSYRTLEVSRTVNGKVRITEIFTRANTSTTAPGAGFHDLNAIVLSGIHSNILYQTPLSLKGSGLGSSGSNNPDGIATGGAETTRIQLSLVRALTDPIPSGETLAQTVLRLKEHLNARGFIEFVP